jgi:hypothetical protein
MDTDIRDEVERSFDEGPPVDDLDLLLTRGRAAVRRRRLAEGASLLLVAGVVAVVALVSMGGSTETSAPDPAGPPTTTVTPTSPPAVPDPIQPDVDANLTGSPSTAIARLVRTDPRVDPFDAVDLRSDGTIHVSRDVVVTRLDRHPWTESEGSRAVALVYEQGGVTHWFAGRQTGVNGTSASTPTIPARTFADWVAEQQTALHLGGGA